MTRVIPKALAGVLACRERYQADPFANGPRATVEVQDIQPVRSGWHALRLSLSSPAFLMRLGQCLPGDLADPLGDVPADMRADAIERHAPCCSNFDFAILSRSANGPIAAKR